MIKTRCIKNSTILGVKIRNYIKWKYKGKRTACHMSVLTTGQIKITTRCHKKDHYPTKMRNAYRRHTVYTEYVNQYQMAECWKYNK